MKPVFHLKINKINELRLTRVFLLVGLFLLMSGKGWAQTATISGTTTVCQGATPPDITFEGANGTTPYTFTYTIDGVLQLPITTTGINSSFTLFAPTVAAGEFIYVLVSVTDDVSNNFVITVNSATVTINELPTITGTTPGSVCGTGTVILGATASAGTLNWYDALTGGTLVGTGTPFTTPSISSTIIYYVDATEGGCTTDTRTELVATVNPLPAAPGIITGTPAVCQGQASVIYSVDAIANAAGYIWTLPAGATISAGDNTISIAVNFSASAASGDITVQGSNSCGTGTVSANYSVTVNPLPTTSLIYHF